ncbi:uncharacterized protein LOC133355473 [Lethenteron reissneri]|uniref:uncharacterized protein LOC133355473 n=1 Tax=Lethenteron reissneri TaxID=7753 RepID=UPI002AB74A92|nr:uncharacterized protein LOC133355473 [Lethenteron reissneri]
MDAAVVAGGTGAAWTRHKQQQQQQPDHDLSHLSSEERECLSFLDSAISSAGGSDYLEEAGSPGDEWDSAAAGGATPWRVNGDDACHVAGDAASPAAGGQATPGHQRGAAGQQQQQPQPLPRRVMTNRPLVLPEPPSPGPQHSGPPSPGSQSSGPPSPGSISSGSSSSGSQGSGFLSLSVPSSGPPSPRPDSPLSSPQTPRPGTKPPLRIAPAHGKGFNTIIKAGVNVTKRRSIMLALLNGENQADDSGPGMGSGPPANPSDPNPAPRSRSQRASLQPGPLTGDSGFPSPRDPAFLRPLSPGRLPPSSDPGSKPGGAQGLANGAVSSPQRRGSEPTTKDPRWKRNFFKI